VRDSSVWERACGLTRTVVENVEFDDDAEAIVVAVRPNARARGRCGRCGRRSPGYDHGEGRRRWRALDLGTTKVFIEAHAPRVRCRTHGVVVASVPWARHDAGHTRDFDETAAWLAVRTSKTAVCELLRVAWRTVGSIVARVNADVDAKVDRLAGLTRIGVDEISYKRGHRYLIVVVDHDTGRLVWAAPGRDSATLHKFFDDLGPERCEQLTHVSADMAVWIARVVAHRAPNAVRCADAFHVVHWAIESLDVERRRAWNEAAGRRRTGTNRYRVTSRGDASKVRHARFALWKNNEHLTDRQRHQLDWIAKTDPRLWRAYLLKEALRYVFAVKGDEGKEALEIWLRRARRSRLPSFIDLAQRIDANRAAIDATLEHGLSNALIESTNTKIRLLTRVAFGFHGPQPVIALAMLALGAQPPRLPGRNHPRK
jgi:transposase